MAQCKFCDGTIARWVGLEGRWTPVMEDGRRHDCREEISRRCEQAYWEGHAAGRASRATLRPSMQSQLSAAELREMVLLTHPDLHPSKQELATRVTAKLLGLRREAQ